MRLTTFSVHAIHGLPLVEEGDDLPALIAAAISASGVGVRAGDILVLAQKIVSKAEGRTVRLDAVTPTNRAKDLAAECGKDPRLVELILLESDAILRVRPGILIVRHRLGLVLANAGIDQSNVAHAGGPSALLLPRDPDASAKQIREALMSRGHDLPVLIIDSLGRAWRLGTIGTAIGASGFATLLDLRGRPDIFGRELESSELGFADEVAAAASLLMGQADEAVPAVIVRGLPAAGEGRAADLLRPPRMDLFA